MVAPEQSRGKCGPGNEEGYHDASDTGGKARQVEKTMERIDKG